MVIVNEPTNQGNVAPRPACESFMAQLLEAINAFLDRPVHCTKAKCDYTSSAGERE